LNKYGLVKAQIAELLDEAANQALHPGDVIEALIVQAVQTSIQLRGTKPTRACLEFELSNIEDSI